MFGLTRIVRSLSVVLLALASIAVPLVPLLGCAGTAARQNVEVPALVLASAGVEDDARRGIAALPQDQQPAASVSADGFFGAVRSKDRKQISAVAVPSWPQVKTWAQAGIADKQAKGEIGPGVAGSLTERLARFESALTQAAAR